MRRRRSENSMAMGLLCRFEVLAQAPRLALVDVRRRVPVVGVVVDQHPDHHRQRAGHRHLAGAQERDALEAELARRDGGELGVEVVGEGEDAADDVVRAERVALHDVAHERLGGVEDRVGLVAVDRGGAAEGEQAHRRGIMPRMARRSLACGALAAVAVLAGCGGANKVQSVPPAGSGRGLTVTSPAFTANGPIPARFTCTGAGDRPALRFGGVPAGAKELALLVIDPDAGGFVHWTVYGMAPSVRGIAATGLPAGAREGRNSTGKTGWTPPCPPSGTHRYRFDLYWLRAASKLAAGADPQTVIDAIKGAAAGRGELIGRFGRGG